MMSAVENPITTHDLIDRALESNVPSVSKGRGHLGFSQIGTPCERDLWYGFRWATLVSFPARMLRLFDRGQKEELRFNEWLRLAGLQVWDVNPNTRKQWRVKEIAGHMGGSLDGVIKGLVESKKPHVVEQKTHNDRSFKDVVRRGVEASKPQHFSQMQGYMYLMDIEDALYMAINKNDDDLYLERVKLKKIHAKELIKKGRRIITAPLPLGKLSEDPGFYQCKWCDHYN